MRAYPVCVKREPRTPSGQPCGRDRARPVSRYRRAMVTKDDVVEVLHGVEDPVLGMDIVELGLYYDAEIEGENVKSSTRSRRWGALRGR